MGGEGLDWVDEIGCAVLEGCYVIMDVMYSWRKGDYDSVLCEFVDS